MKKRILTKEFQGMLKHLKWLDDKLGFSIDRDKKEAIRQGLIKEREMVLEQIWGNWPRKMIVDKDVLQMKGNALKNPEVKKVLERTGSQIEDCALVESWGMEEHVGKRHDCPAHCEPKQIKSVLTESGWGNTWETRYSYKWGGPRDVIKILFHRSANNLFRCTGIIQTFPGNKKKAA
jgi:hypothetical protein